MSKGSSFEREVCCLLSKWWTGGKRDDIFYRSNSSGGRFTARKKSGKDTAYQGGDVTFTDPSGEPLIKEWNIELKSGYGKNKKILAAKGKVVKVQSRWDVLDLIDSSQKETVIEKMWNQCSRDAHATNRKPVLIFRRNGRRICIAIERTYFSYLSDYFGSVDNVLMLPSPRMVIMPLCTFLDWIPSIKLALSGE